MNKTFRPYTFENGKLTMNEKKHYCLLHKFHVKPKLEEVPYSSTDVAEGVYMPHENIEEHIMDFVKGNIESSKGHQHMREVLDDIILDLSNFRNALATPEQYLEKDLL